MDSDLTAAQRMAAIQLADLGSTRREEVSTHDLRSKEAYVSLEKIENTREFRKSKSAAGRQFAAFESKLNAWSGLHEQVEDTENIEKLDSLMHGQSHRAKLSAQVKATGGQQYGEGYGKNKHNRPENNHPIPSSSAGRGGGVAGTRPGHARAKPSGGHNSQFAKRSLSLALPASPNLTRQATTAPNLTRQDPALDQNNSDPVVDRRHHRGGRGRAAKAPPTRTRRPQPMEDFTFKISTPQDFMDIARQYTQSVSQPSTVSSPRLAASTPSIAAPVVASPHRATSPARIAATPAPRSSRSQSVSPSRRSVTFAGPVTRKPCASPPPQPMTQDDDPLIEFSSEEDEKPPIPAEVISKPSSDLLLLDFGTTEDSSIPQQGLSETTQIQLQGLDFRFFNDGKLPENLQKVNVRATDLMNDLGGCRSIIEDKLSHALKESGTFYPPLRPRRISTQEHEAPEKGQPQRVSTPEHEVLQKDPVTPEMKGKGPISFLDHRSPDKSSTSSDSIQREKAKRQDDNLSPRKKGRSDSDPINGFGKLQISEPPGLGSIENEPRPAASKPKEMDVCPAARHGGIGSLAQSIHAVDVVHARSMGTARTIGVKPSLTYKTEAAEVTIEYQRANPTSTRAPSGASTPAVRPSGLATSRFASEVPSVSPPAPRAPGLSISRFAPEMPSAESSAPRAPGLSTSRFASEKPRAVSSASRGSLGRQG